MFGKKKVKGDKKVRKNRFGEPLVIRDDVVKAGPWTPIPASERGVADQSAQMNIVNSEWEEARRKANGG